MKPTTTDAPAPRLEYDDRVPPSTRWLAAALLPFLAVAFVLLYVWPDRTDRLFAWTIRPDMTAMMLAAAYFGGLFFFWRVTRETHWHRVQIGFPAVLGFATLLSVATALHWDRFHPGHISFIAWASLYFVTPFLVFGTWWANRRADSGALEAGDALLAPAWRALFVCIGVVTLTVGVGMFIWPQLAIPVWPWMLTPLTARMVGALFTLPGVVGLLIARDGRWSATRTLVQAQLIGIALILLGALRDRASFDFSNFPAWGFVCGLSAMFALLIVLLLTYDARVRTPAGTRRVEPPARA